MQNVNGNRLMRPDSERELLRVLLFFGLALVLSRVIASIILPQYDDSFITMRYARNLASGLGFVYNAGEHVLGETCPAFGLLQALFFTLHLPMPVSVLAFNIVCDLLILILTVRILFRNQLQIPAILFGIVFTLNPIMSRICIGGMEMDIYLLLSISAIVLYHNGKKYLAVSIASLSYFVRPEAVLLVALFCMMELFAKRWKTAIALGMLSLLLVALPLYSIYSYYGSIIAQSVVAKSRWVSGSYLIIFRQLIFNDWLQIILLPFAIWGFIRIWRKEGIIRTVAIWTALYIGAYLLYRAFVFSWYGEAVHYAEILLASIGVADIFGRVMPNVSNKLRSQTFVGVASAIVVAIWICVYALTGPSVITTNVYNKLNAWYRTHPSESVKILAGDIGAIGFYSNAYIYDSDGLVWPDAIKYHSDAEMIARFKPDYLFLNLTKSTQDLLTDPQVGTHYHLLQDFTATPYNMNALPQGWFQSYALFQRSE